MKSSQKRKIHPLIFLLLLGSFAYGSVYLFNNFNVFFPGISKKIVSAQYQLTTFFSSTRGVIDKASTNSSGGSVLGCNDGTERCSFNNRTPFEPVCVQGDAGVSLVGGAATATGGGVEVRKNAKIELYKITYPNYFTGSPYVSDERKAISKEGNFMTYKPAAQTLDPRDAESQNVPGDETFEREYDGAARGDFAVNARAGLNDETSSGDATVSYPDFRSRYDFIRDDDYNPEAANNVAADLRYGMMAPGQTEWEEDTTEEENTEVECKATYSNAINLDEAVNYQSCISNSSPAFSMISAAFDFNRWQQCLNGDASCEKVTIVGIMVDDVFGNDEEENCDDKACTNAYLSSQITKNTAPGKGEDVTAASYITTPCKILVDGRVKNISCYWKAPMVKEYYIQRGIKGPGDENYPTIGQYLGGIKKELKTRAVSCL